MTILSLDLGTKLGWAVYFGKDEDGKLDIIHGTVEFRVGRMEGGGMMWLRFRKWLNEIAEGSGPLEAVYFEECVGFGQFTGRTASAFGGFLAILTSWCESKGIPYSGIPVGTIKKHATGKGNANKATMIRAVRDLGFTPEDDNAADAIALMMFVTKDEKAAAA